MKEVGRKDYGMTDKGAVMLVAFEGTADPGEALPVRYEVRHGVRTVGSFETRAKAEAVAKVLVG